MWWEADAMLTDATARSLFDLLALGLLLAALASVLLRRLDQAPLLLAVQGLLLALAAATFALGPHGETHNWIAASVTLAVKAILIPGLVKYTLRGVRARPEAQAVLPRKQAFPLAIALVLVAYYVAGPLTAADAALTR